MYCIPIIIQNIMTNELLYETIFKRKSTRKYNMTPLSSSALEEIKNYAASSLIPLDDSIQYKFSYLNSEDVKNLLPIKAPHYICLYSEQKENYLTNAGFLLQQMDLYFSVNNLGSCWLGMAKPSKQVPPMKNGLEFVIMIAFGASLEPVHRTDSSQFKRIPFENISSITDARELLEPARLAPSASNSQPWYFSGNTREITISRKKLNPIKESLLGKMNRIDIGISVYHLFLALKHLGRHPAFDFKNSPAPKGYEFILRMKIEEN